MKGLRILLVDDEPLMRLSMVDALEIGRASCRERVYSSV